MKKLLILPILLAVALTGCERNTTNPGTQDPSTNALQLTEGLEDCKMYSFKRWDGLEDPILIVRCPNSTVSTSYREGKKTRTVITADAFEASQTQ